MDGKRNSLLNYSVGINKTMTLAEIKLILIITHDEPSETENP